MQKNLALAAIALVFLLGAAQAQSPNSVPEQLKAIQSGISDLKAQNASLANQVSNLEAQNAALAAQVASNAPRKFYLTKTTHNGAETLSACAAGYHMASLWEIHDPSNLRYDTVLGFTTDDSGFGPPAGLIPVSIFGWIRTGGSSHGSAIPLSANCRAWTTNDISDSGTQVAPTHPSILGSSVDPWRAQTRKCVIVERVWCVQD